MIWPVEDGGEGSFSSAAHQTTKHTSTQTRTHSRTIFLVTLCTLTPHLLSAPSHPACPWSGVYSNQRWSWLAEQWQHHQQPQSSWSCFINSTLSLSESTCLHRSLNCQPFSLHAQTNTSTPTFPHTQRIHVHCCDALNNTCSRQHMRPLNRDDWPSKATASQLIAKTFSRFRFER